MSTFGPAVIAILRSHDCCNSTDLGVITDVPCDTVLADSKSCFMGCMSDVPGSSRCHNPAERPVSVPLHPVSRRIGVQVHSLVLSSGRIFVTRSGYTVGDST